MMLKRVEYKERIASGIVRPEISEDELIDLNFKVLRATPGDVMSVKYYTKGNVIHLTGILKKKNIPDRYLRIEKTIIKFQDLIEIY